MQCGLGFCDPTLKSDPCERRSRRPLVELLLLAVPTIAQMASYTVMQFADVFFNWLFVFGHWGFRPMSVAGSA